MLAAVLAAAVIVTVVLATRHRAEPVRADNAVGDSACLSCHQDKQAYEQTAHRLTSRHPSQASIAGSFATGQNVLTTSNAALHFRMDARDSGFYQTAVLAGSPSIISRTERFDLVVGSGRKGQTYAYRHGDRLSQLPVSYWTSLGAWINSPGYLDGSVNFERPITPRCLECHSTWIETIADSLASNRYRPGSEILGLTCEKCHAAGREHVARQRSALRSIRGTAIVNPATLPRVRQIEGCAQCHGGVGTPQGPSFAYVPGTPLSPHLRLPPPAPGERVDVHGNQVALLARSACFQRSPMTCASCHDVHRQQRDPVALSARCLTCHGTLPAGLVPTHDAALRGRCVDCHMPQQTSDRIISDLGGRQERPAIRTHWIKVYPDAAAGR